MSHPWMRSFNNANKLKEARKISAKRAKQLYDKEYYDELKMLSSRARARKKSGIPIDLPVMKGWDFAKGRVKPTS